MTEFFKMDMFFLVSTIGFVIIALLIAVVLFYVIRILRSLDRIMEDIASEVHSVKEDVDGMRSFVQGQGTKIFTLVGVAQKAIMRFVESRRRQAP